MSLYLFLFKQKTAYEMRISDRSSDVCSSDLLAARPLRAEMDEIASIRLPAVLHWDLTHFVVLKAVKRTLSGPRYIVHDPARGIVSLGATEMSRHWTGIALELAPTGALTRVDQRARLRLSQLGLNLIGLKSALVQALGLSLLLQIGRAHV